MVTVTKYVWDPVFDCVSHELDENNAVKAVYHNEPQQYGGVISQRRGTTSHYHHHDALGSTRFLTDSSGNVTDTYLHDAWGYLVESTGTTVNPFKWVGKYGYYTENSTGQVYVRARMYQPTVARWCSVDPLIAIGHFDSIFRYVLNGPLSHIDVTGLVCEDPTTMPYVSGRGEFTDIVFRGSPGPGSGERGKWRSIFNLEWQSSAGAFHSIVDETSCCCCDQVAFVQIARTQKDRGIAWHWETDWFLDSGTPYSEGLAKSARTEAARNLPTSGDPCTSKILTLGMFDSPGIWPDPFGPFSNGLERYRQKFETCVVCLSGLEGPRSGNSVGAIYGCVTWEHEFRYKSTGDEVRRRLLSNIKGFGLLSKDQIKPSYWDIGFGKDKTGVAAYGPSNFFHVVMSKGSATDDPLEYWYQ
jgi:RHS repeat-associated protein